MPKHTSLAMAVRHLTGSAHLIGLLNGFNHATSHTLALEDDTALAKQEIRTGGSKLPSCLQESVFTTLVWDNNDFGEETLSGRGTTHNTNGIAIQHRPAASSRPIMDSTNDRQKTVHVFDIMKNNVTHNDVLIMGTDGLWDITSNSKAAEIVKKSLDHFPPSEKSRCQIRYTSAAQDLVMHSRGKLREKNWKTSDNKLATIDDISVFVIPLLPYKEEFTLFMEENEWIKSKL
ncbi:Protein phosphatase 1J [Nymphon striatum]|nr:Protein phosphatase 1J [Nymphon striatum]KAG1712242.1 Protein phosphatase 1J [Nymphon striatum]